MSNTRMFGPPRQQIPHMRWGYQRTPFNSQWRHPIGPHAPSHGPYQRFNHPRPPFQSQNDNYWCETCDRGFPTQDILNKHNQQHQKCNIDGCQFIAHPKVITKHIQMQHSTGLYKKIANIKNPEEIEKWREERRKRYPTKANIDKKAAILKEKIDRGEKMGLERDRNHHNQPNSDHDNKLAVPGQGVKRKFNARNENQPRSKFRRNNFLDNSNKNPQPRDKLKPANNNKNYQAKDKLKPAPTSVEDKRLKPFAGILNLQMDSDNEIEDDSVESNSLIEFVDDEEFKGAEIIKIPENSEPVVCGALSSLMCDYGSSEEEDNDALIKTDPKDLDQQPNHTIKPGNAKSNFVSETKHNDENKESIIVKNADNHKGVQNGDDKNELKQIIETKNTIIVTPEHNKKTQSDSNIDNIPKEVEMKICDISTLSNDKCEEDSDSGPEEMKTDVRKEDTSSSLEEPKTKNERSKDERKSNIKGRMQANRYRKPKLPSTLLQKLLSKEMQQERNIILQCIRYIRRNNYFDKTE